MIRHLCRLVWNRKRANAMVAMEILLCFLVVFGVLLLGVSMASNAGRPVGYSTTDVWNIELGRELDEARDSAGLATTERLVAVARGLAPVEAAAATLITPYSTSRALGTAMVNGRELLFAITIATDELPAVLRLSLVAGRWFGKQDDHARDDPVIVTADLARALFGDADPIGREIPDEASEGSARRRRVIGVLSTYRAGGELGSESMFALYRADQKPEQTGPESRALPNLVVRVRPGTPRSFEETLVKALQTAAPDHRFTVETLSEMKARYMDRYLVPLGIAAVIAGFLILMVALGLTGVLWQNVTRRTKEIGLRRAMGATARQISLQIIAETWILATLALVLGSVLVLQLPVLDLLPFVTTRAFALSFAISLATLYALCALCALYPSWLATRVSPTEALRHE